MNEIGLTQEEILRKKVEEFKREIERLQIENLTLIEEKDKVLEEIKPLSELIENGMGEFNFMQTITNNTYKREYNPVNEEIYSEFVPLEHIYDYLDMDIVQKKPSIFLNSFRERVPGITPVI